MSTNAPVAAYVAALNAGEYPVAVAAYVAATSGDKARMRVAHQEAVKVAMRAATTPDDLIAVNALMDVAEAQSAAVATKAPVAVDPRVDQALVVSSLLAKAVYAMQDVEGDEDLTFIGDLITMATGIDFGDLFAQVVDGPGIAGDVATFAGRIKVPASRRNAAPGGDIAAHVYQVMSEAPEGAVYTVAQVARATSDAYPEGAPSDGAISARLFPRDGSDCTIDGVTPCYTESGHKGVRLS